jgi:hypothetical protein
MLEASGFIHETVNYKLISFSNMYIKSSAMNFHTTFTSSQPVFGEPSAYRVQNFTMFYGTL